MFRSAERLLCEREDTMESNKELVQKFTRALASRDVDTAVACCAADLVNHAAIPSAQGASGLRTIFAKLFKAMPDMIGTVEDVICEGDRVVVRMTMRGTNTGPWEMVAMPFPATGKSATVE